MRAGKRLATGGWRPRATGLSALLALVGLLLGTGPVVAQVEVVEYYATDALGSVRVVFNADGQVVARADYQPFGELFAPVGELPPQQFTGQARDGEAGLDYFGARFYQPRHGRFTQVDPVYAGLFDPQQWNRYTYARANPLSFVDPDGRCIAYAELLRPLGDDLASLPHVDGGSVPASGLTGDLASSPQRPSHDDGKRTRGKLAGSPLHGPTSSKWGRRPELSYTAHASASGR